MNINELNTDQFLLFCQNAEVAASKYGGRKFVTEITSNGNQYKISASAKDIYDRLDLEQYSHSENSVELKWKIRGTIIPIFRKKEITTRNSSVFSKNLNFLQKIYYFIVKLHSGLDDWKYKFFHDQLGNRDNVYDSNSETWENRIDNKIAKDHIYKVLKDNFNGSKFETVIVNVKNRTQSGLGAFEAVYDFKNTSPYGIENQKLFYNSKVLYIDIGRNEKDPTIPNNASLAHYYIGTKAEYENLAKSAQFKNFMQKAIDACA